MSKTYHQVLDQRLLCLVKASIQKIDENPALCHRLIENVQRWPEGKIREQWQKRLAGPWSHVRAELLAENESGDALRQDAPLGGILTTIERAALMKPFRYDASAT